jgi:hypothetical protein
MPPMYVQTWVKLDAPDVRTDMGKT